MIQNWVTNNLGLKLTSLAMAILLWFFVILSGRSELTIEVPVIYENLAPGLEVVDAPFNVSVRIEGQERILKNLKKDELHAALNLRGAREGRTFFTLSEDNFKIPRTVAMKSIDPETISVKIEVQMKKSVPIKSAIVGLPERGYVISEISVSPEKVTLEGPESIVSRIEAVKTEPIDINGLKNNLQYKANLNLVNQNIRKNVNKVEVNIVIEKIP
ncbi:MAG: YbbR-like domain-containing protein [Nitrospira sp.]|nr:YbbR-like domain-containing protein [bacterium]MBL7049108.1 YbbR-like domain-containing protein [Nitrospira sp.]